MRMILFSKCLWYICVSLHSAYIFLRNTVLPFLVTGWKSKRAFWSVNRILTLVMDLFSESKMTPVRKYINSTDAVCEKFPESCVPCCLNVESFFFLMRNVSGDWSCPCDRGDLWSFIIPVWQMFCQHEAPRDLSAVAQIKPQCSLAPPRSATSGCSHWELAPRHKHSLGHISTDFSDLSSFKPQTHMHALLPTHACVHCKPIWSLSHPQKLFKEGLKNVLGIKISFESVRMGNLIGWKQEHVTRVSQLRELGTMRVKLPSCLLFCVSCTWYLYQQWKCQCRKVRTQGKHLWLQHQWHALSNVRSLMHWDKVTCSQRNAVGNQKYNQDSLCQSKWCRKENQ